ncbi:MAG: hypothetical protein CMJ64_30460 [Planctomycetaceae bacterium]|nr:hypothetical protein [Planctomycetaceae bacterium]
MGIHDRDYYRDDQPSGVSLGQQSMVTKIMMVTAGVFIADMFVASPSHWLMYGMTSSAHDFFNPLYWWRFLASGFAHDPNNIWHLLGNMAGLFFLGRSVEQAYGPKEFLRVYLVAIVLGTLAQAFLAYATNSDGPWAGCMGASGAVTTVVVLFIFNFPKATLLLFFVIPTPAWVVGLLIIGYNLLGVGGVYVPVGMGEEYAKREAYDVHLVGAAFGVAYFYFRWNLGRLLPSGGVLKSIKRRPKLRVHDPDADHQVRDSQADALLDKVNREGMDSLTAREQKILEEYSRRMRQKHR